MKKTHDGKCGGGGGGCSDSATPCAPSGSCAFDGAKVVLQPITDAVHLVHGPIACEGNSWDYRPTSSSGPRQYRAGLTTDLSEVALVMGSEKHLYESMRQIAERHTPAAIFVYSTCVTGVDRRRHRGGVQARQ
jgi:nitrogenase molybdenum-iron protein alpha/beta subunit